jgi:HEAT repeat protein
MRVSSGGHASHAVARALVTLVERLEVLNAAMRFTTGGPDAQGTLSTSSEIMDSATAGARDALRQLAARSRDGALLCRVIDGVLVLEGVPVSYKGLNEDRFLDVLLNRLVAIGAGSLTVRDGAAPGELLTLGRLLVPSRGADTNGVTPLLASSTVNDTPTAVRVFGTSDDAPRELLRTWSVLVMPASDHAGAAVATQDPGTALARLAAARTDAAATAAVASLIERLDDAQRRGDGAVVEGIARGCVAHLHSIGGGGGRVALEGAVRYLLRPPLLTLLAQRLPASTDRAALLQLLSRAGDTGVETLITQLMSTDDALARRAYFDGIVAIDVASTLLFDLLTDSRWFVVRNAAALLGEMNVEHTDVALVPLLLHEDERIRIAVARALTRVRTPKALQALHACLDDPQPEVRRLAAASFGLAGGAGGGIRPPAARLTAALDRETDEDVALEMLASLGRLGSADAVQRLVRIAVPTTADTGGDRAGTSRDPWRRIAALEALVRARGHAMVPVIEVLMSDNDRDVAAAATRLRATVGGG